jgi:hypothetical protein
MRPKPEDLTNLLLNKIYRYQMCCRMPSSNDDVSPTGFIQKLLERDPVDLAHVSEDLHNTMATHDRSHTLAA